MVSTLGIDETMLTLPLGGGIGNHDTSENWVRQMTFDYPVTVFLVFDLVSGIFDLEEK